MARSVQEIHTQILDAKNAEDGLINLNSSSQTAIYRLFSYVIAVATHFHERTWELFKVDLEEIIDSSTVGTARWLQKKVLEFQYGSTLSIIDDVIVYETIDDTSQIISRCSIKENTINRNVLIKVAKDGIDNTLEKLNLDEINGLKGYLNEIKMAGSKLLVSSFDADRVQIIADIYYDTSILPDIVKASIIEKINEYFQNLDFSGSIYKSQIENAIQSAEGVRDVDFTTLKTRESSQLVTSSQIVERKYETQSGYVVTEDTDTFKIEDTLNMIPFVL